MEPDGRLVVAQGHDRIVEVFVAQRIEPAIALEEAARRDRHDLVEFADSDRPRLLDIPKRERRDGVEGRHIRRYLHADLGLRKVSQGLADRLIAFLQSIQGVGY